MMMGVDRRKLKRAAAGRLNPRNSPTEIVAPEREIPGAIAAAMAYADLVKGMTIEQAQAVTDRDVFRALEEIPDQKQHCIRLAVKTLNKAIDEYGCKNA